MSGAPVSWCDRAGEFFDDELTPDEATAFRAHLDGCAACKQRVFESMMLEATAGAPPARAAATSPGGEVVSLGWFRARRRRLLVSAVAIAAAAAAVLLAIDLGDRRRPIELALAPTRGLEARLSWPGVDRHRPLAVTRGSTAHEIVSLDALARLEQRGDLRGLAAGELLAGERAEATAALARAPDSPDVLSDRAAIALDAGDFARALALANAALAQKPDHAQASWNRALALRDLGSLDDAATAFEAIAARGEPGWSDEARARAAELRAQSQARHPPDAGRAP